MQALLPVLLLLLLSTALPAQLRVGADAGALQWGGEQGNPAVTPLAIHPKPRLLPGKDPGTRGPSAPQLYAARETAFDFSAAKPHLAFFCRLELNIEEATRFPVRFRLGEVRTWQQELTKRD